MPEFALDMRIPLRIGANLDSEQSCRSANVVNVVYAREMDTSEIG